MKKIRTALGILGAGVLICLGIGTFAPGGTLAYLCDHDQLMNQFSVGKNETEIHENFPTPTPAQPEQDNLYPKEVSVTNRESVACYIRLAVVYSDSGIGNAVRLQGLNTTDWKEEGDGYYYYVSPVEPGGTTAPLFSGVLIRKDADYFRETEQFSVYCYEESVQAAKGGVPYADFREAWKLGEGGEEP